MLILQARRADEVGDQLREQRRVLGQYAAVEDGLVAGGPGVEEAADILDRLGNSPGVAASRALEHHMFDEVRETREMLRLGARPDHRIEAKRDGLRAQQRVDGHR